MNKRDPFPSGKKYKPNEAKIQLSFLLVGFLFGKLVEPPLGTDHPSAGDQNLYVFGEDGLSHARSFTQVSRPVFDAWSHMGENVLGEVLLRGVVTDERTVGIAPNDEGMFPADGNVIQRRVIAKGCFECASIE